MTLLYLEEIGLLRDVCVGNYNFIITPSNKSIDYKIK